MHVTHIGILNQFNFTCLAMLSAKRSKFPDISTVPYQPDRGFVIPKNVIGKSYALFQGFKFSTLWWSK